MRRDPGLTYWEDPASGCGFVESDRAGIEALAGGVGPRPGRDTEAASGVVDRLARGHGPTAAVEPVTTMVGEDDAVRIVGVPADSQMAEVV
jgi:hypothetical protein